MQLFQDSHWWNPISAGVWDSEHRSSVHCPHGYVVVKHSGSGATIWQLEIDYDLNMLELISLIFIQQLTSRAVDAVRRGNGVCSAWIRQSLPAWMSGYFALWNLQSIILSLSWENHRSWQDQGRLTGSREVLRWGPLGLSMICWILFYLSLSFVVRLTLQIIWRKLFLST